MKKVKQTVPEFVEHLSEMRDAEVGENHEDYAQVIQLAGESLRVLNLHSIDLYNLVFEGNVYVGSLAEVAENNSEVRNEMEIVKNLDFLYEQLRLLKLEGKAYNVLDEFFNLNLGKTL